MSDSSVPLPLIVVGDSRLLDEVRADPCIEPALVRTAGMPPPDGQAPEETALQQAVAAHLHGSAREDTARTPESPMPSCIGVAVIDHQSHRCIVAIHDAGAAAVIVLSAPEATTRRDHLVEILKRVSARGTSALEKVGNLTDTFVEVVRPDPAISGIWTGDRPVVWCRRGVVSNGVSPNPPTALLSGSFNPLHDGHRRLATVAAEFSGLRSAYELPLWNADKPPLNFRCLTQRLAQFSDTEIAVTRLPSFAEKSRVFPGTVFVLGYDTAVRLLQPRFYDGSRALMDRALDEIRDNHCGFLVAGRLVDGRFRGLSDISVPSRFRALFDALPETLFRTDVSSTELRRRRKQP